MKVVTSALLLFTLHISFVVVKPIQSKQVEVSVLHLANYLPMVTSYAVIILFLRIVHMKTL